MQNIKTYKLIHFPFFSVLWFKAPWDLACIFVQEKQKDNTEGIEDCALTLNDINNFMKSFLFLFSQFQSSSCSCSGSCHLSRIRRIEPNNYKNLLTCLRGLKKKKILLAQLYSSLIRIHWPALKCNCFSILFRHATFQLYCIVLFFFLYFVFNALPFFSLEPISHLENQISIFLW